METTTKETIIWRVRNKKTKEYLNNKAWVTRKHASSSCSWANKTISHKGGYQWEIIPFKCTELTLDEAMEV